MCETNQLYQEISKTKLIKKNKHKIADKCNVISGYIHKMYFYYEKARQDGVITLDELKGFNKILEEFENKIHNINLKDREVTDNFDLSELKKEAEIDAR